MLSRWETYGIETADRVLPGEIAAGVEMSERLEASIVRIFDAAGDVVGAGFLVSEGHVLTCAHVVARALGMEDPSAAMPEAELSLDFPLVAQGTIVAARPMLWRPVDPAPGSPKEAQDVAVLQLQSDPPPPSRPCRLVSSSDLWGHSFRAFGFPPRRDDGVWAAGVLRGRQAAGWVQIEDVDQTGYRVEPGFSGAPVWDEVLGGIAGMAVAAEAQLETRAAYMIPTAALVAAWPPLGTQAMPPPGRAADAWLHWSAPRLAARPATNHRATSPTGPSSTQWPFVGRGAERTRVAEAIRSGRGGAVLSGPAGVGKTYLAIEALREAEQEGCSTTWVVATKAAASIPFGSFAHLLPQIPAGSLGRLDLLRQIGDALVAQAAGRRVAIGVDDAHLLDDASAALVHQLAMSGAAFVVVTLRTGESPPDSIVALWKEGLAERFDLGPLSETEVSELLPCVLGGQVDTPTLARLWRATRGNALFLRELVLAGLENGTLVELGEVWCWRGAMAMSLRLQEIVAARLGTLEGDQLALMEVVAHGEPVSAFVLETMLPPTALETAERRGLVTVELSGRRTLVRPAHPIYGELLRARCPLLRARTIRRKLATALEASGARRVDDLLPLATFHLESGEPGRPELLLSGAQHAFAMFDFGLSERLARAALEADGGVAAKLAIARTLLEQGRAAEIVELLGDVGDLDLTEEETTAASDLLASALRLLGQPAEAEQILLRTEKALQSSVLRDDVSSIRARILLWSGRPQRTTAIFEDLERTSTNERACLLAAAAAPVACAFVGRVEQALAVAERWIPRAPHVAADLPHTRLMMRVGQSLALGMAGRFADADGVANDLHREAVSRHSEFARGGAAFVLGYVALIRGKVSAALRWLREAAAASRQPSRFQNLPICLAELAQACVLTGDLAGADAALGDADEAMHPGVALLQPMLLLGRAWLSLGQGDGPGARLIALQAADEAEASGQYAIAVVALHDLARFGQPETSRLNRLASLVEGPFAPACALHAAALAAKDGQGLDQAASHFAALGANLLGAEAAAEAAAVHRAEGDNEATLASSAMARRHLDACEGVDKSFIARLGLLAPDGSCLLPDDQRAAT